ncbi:hypothetical protein BGZ76_009628 [Entomortierella beljakovae]|nr:hypothetical protein BGZ76_009628 [Entomortierella beljakovae]
MKRGKRIKEELRICLSLPETRQLRAHSALMTRYAESRTEEFERLKRHYQGFIANGWNHTGMEPELRVCFVMNRFTRNLIIMYASPATELLFNIESAQLIGKPVLLFVRADDLASFVEQVDVVKASSAIMHMRFWFQSPNLSDEIPCEAMLIGSSDGLAAVVRRCKPFVRKRLIKNDNHFRTTENGSRWDNVQCLTSTPSSASTSPIRDVPMSRLRNIKILDGDENTRSWDEAMSADPRLTNMLPDGFGIKEYRMQEFIDDEDDNGSDQIEG